MIEAILWECRWRKNGLYIDRKRKNTAWDSFGSRKRRSVYCAEQSDDGTGNVDRNDWERLHPVIYGCRKRERHRCLMFPERLERFLKEIWKQEIPKWKAAVRMPLHHLNWFKTSAGLEFAERCEYLQTADVFVYGILERGSMERQLWKRQNRIRQYGSRRFIQML